MTDCRVVRVRKISDEKMNAIPKGKPEKKFSVSVRTLEQTLWVRMSTCKPEFFKTFFVANCDDLLHIIVRYTWLSLSKKSFVGFHMAREGVNNLSR